MCWAGSPLVKQASTMGAQGGKNPVENLCGGVEVFLPHSRAAAQLEGLLFGPDPAQV